MDLSLLQNKFARLGARLAAKPDPRLPLASRIDIQRDGNGEYFDLAFNPSRVASVDAIDVRPGERHLLLLVRTIRLDPEPPLWKQKFLCGHDERSWFVAAVPEDSGASSVATAMEALKPPAVRLAQDRVGLRLDQRHRRRNEAFRRQGEWFFLPRPDIQVDPRKVLRNEPLRRGAGKPHWAEFCFRTGGETVYVSHVAPNGFTASEAQRWSRQNRGVRITWQVMRRNPTVLVKGRIRHADHATIELPVWHEVHMNTESRAQAMRSVAFLD
jgi:hypothetical protein